MTIHHHHGHAHEHAHAPGAGFRGDRKRLAIVAAAMAGAAAVEVVAGRAANSLALLSDAAHAATDVLALLFSLYAVHLAATRPADAKRTFGYGRAELIAALANAALLWAVAILIVVQAYRRIGDPPRVDHALVTIAALVVLVVEIAAFAYLWRRSRSNLNVRSAFVHLAGDAGSTIAVALSGVAIRFTGLSILDPLVAVLIALVIAAWAVSLTRETVHILVQGVPAGMDLGAVRSSILAVEGVSDVHDLHVWSITEGQATLSAHIVADPGSAMERIPRDVRRMLHDRYRIDHVTLQVESPDTECEEPHHP